MQFTKSVLALIAASPVLTCGTSVMECGGGLVTRKYVQTMETNLRTQ